MTDLRTDNPDAVAWQTERTAETLAALHAIDGYEAFGASVLRYADAAQLWTPVRAGKLWFQQRRPDPDADLPVITVRDSVAGTPRVLVDFNDHAVDDGPVISPGWVSPSPDGTVLAYSITAEGTEVNEVYLVDVATGDRLPDELPWNVIAAPSWLPDSSGFWCLVNDITPDAVHMVIRRFILGEPASSWTAPLPDDAQFPQPKVAKDGQSVAITTGNTELRVDYVITKDLQVKRLLVGVPGMFRGAVSDDTLYALTDNGAPRGRIVGIPLDTSTDLSSWTELLPESSDTITDFEIIDDTLVVSRLRDCAAVIDVIDLSTGISTEIPLPGRGGAGTLLERVFHPGLPVFTRGSDEISFIYSDPATAPAIYRYGLDDRRLECLEAPATALPDVTVSYITAVSADGIEIPAHVIHRADLDLSRAHPTLLYGYGGFQLAELPAYVNGYAAWIEVGGIYVVSHLRGGGEFGAHWWRDGRRERKQNTFNDFYAVAEKLLELGWTSRAQLAIYGASNGGLLAAVALTQRPDLWAAVVSDVPAVDLLNLDRYPFMYAIGREEYGDPRIAHERAWLAEFDPVANAKAAHYPATLVVAGANDPRCPAGQARLLVDTVRCAQTGDAPILLRVHAEQGHGTFRAADAARRLTEILAFCAEHTGLALP